MSLRHYEQASQLWKASEGVVFRPQDDDRQSIQRYLRRNARLSLVAVNGKKLVGTLLVGHDGRRGILRHLAVDAAYRRRGVGRRLVKEALRRLKGLKIQRAFIFILAKNRQGRKFWKSQGWEEWGNVVAAGIATS